METPILFLLLLGTAIGSGSEDHHHSHIIPVEGYETELQDLGQHVEVPETPVRVIKITKTIAVKVPVPYPVKVIEKVPYPVTVNKPYPVPVPQIVKVPQPVVQHPHHQQQPQQALDVGHSPFHNQQNDNSYQIHEAPAHESGGQNEHFDVHNHDDDNGFNHPHNSEYSSDGSPSSYYSDSPGEYYGDQDGHNSNLAIQNYIRNFNSNNNHAGLKPRR